MTASAELLQMLSNLWPHLLEASLQVNPEERVKHFLAVYRRLPMISEQCGVEVAHEMLINVRKRHIMRFIASLYFFSTSIFF